MKPGVYHNLTMAEYLAIPAISQGVLWELLNRCPRAAWHCSHLNPNREREESTEMDVGTIAHAMLFEGGASMIRVLDPNDYPAKNGNIPDGWTNNAIREARDQARAEGYTPILAPMMPKIEAMVRAAQDYINSMQELEPAVWSMFQRDGGESEVTYVWIDDGVLCKARADRVSADATIVVDGKFGSGSSEPSAFGRQAERMGYFFGGGFYRRGFDRLFGKRPLYLWLPQETDPPYLTSIVGQDAAGIALADEQVGYAMSEWWRCLQNMNWPGYAPRVAYVETPPWAVGQWEERAIESGAVLK